jgi:two-component system phosphate regulon sensor histidine kinase PhoR
MLVSFQQSDIETSGQTWSQGFRAKGGSTLKAIIGAMVQEFSDFSSHAATRLPSVSIDSEGISLRRAMRLTLVARREITRALRRIIHKRKLLVLIASVLVLFVLLDDVPVMAGLSGFALITFGAGVLTTEGPRWRPRPVLVAQKIIEGLPEPAIVLTAKGMVLSFNSKARELFEGLRLDQHVSSSIRNPDVLQAVRAASSADPRQTVSYVERVPVEQHLSVAVSWIGAGGGSVGGTTAEQDSEPSILLFLHDLTEQERLDQMRSDFIANASHELKTPLAAVLGFIETLQGAARNDTEARERFLGIMAKQAERMAALIDDLMSLSRVEMKAHIRPQDLVEINGAVHYVADSLKEAAASAGIELKVASLPGEAMVVGDSEEIVQVVQNLVHNGVKYGRKGGHVWVSVERLGATAKSGPRIAIAVRDDGVGIGRDYIPRLTERFYRAPDCPSDRAGTGLGLAIVKHVINRHRGEFKVLSEPNKGSVFTVTFAESLEA